MEFHLNDTELLLDDLEDARGLRFCPVVKLVCARTRHTAWAIATAVAALARAALQEKRGGRRPHATAGAPAQEADPAGGRGEAILRSLRARLRAPGGRRAGASAAAEFKKCFNVL